METCIVNETKTKKKTEKKCLSFSCTTICWHFSLFENSKGVKPCKRNSANSISLWFVAAPTNNGCIPIVIIIVDWIFWIATSIVWCTIIHVVAADVCIYTKNMHIMTCTFASKRNVQTFLNAVKHWKSVIRIECNETASNGIHVLERVCHCTIIYGCESWPFNIQLWHPQPFRLENSHSKTLQYRKVVKCHAITQPFNRIMACISQTLPITYKQQRYFNSIS